MRLGKSLECRELGEQAGDGGAPSAMNESDAPLANVLTLGVHDLALVRHFYRELGWPLVLDRPDYAVFELASAERG